MFSEEQRQKAELDDKAVKKEKVVWKWPKAFLIDKIIKNNHGEESKLSENRSEKLK